MDYRAALAYDDCMSTAPINPALTEMPAGPKKSVEEYYWLWLVCLLGLDYFSTLAYQPSITFHETGDLGPLATAAVVFVTLFGALPVYCYLAGQSPGGQGSLGLVEKLIHGWRGKTLVLILLGFAATDFTMLKSLSLADASVHVLNQHDDARRESAHQFAGWLKDCTTQYCGEQLGPYINEQLVVTIVLGIVAFVFWFVLRKGFNRNVMILAVPLVTLYLVLTGILIGGGLWILYQHPDMVREWLSRVERGTAQIPGVSHRPLEGWGRTGSRWLQTCWQLAAEPRAGPQRFRAEHDPDAAGAGEAGRATAKDAHSQHAQGADRGGGHHVGLSARQRVGDDAVD